MAAGLGAWLWRKPDAVTALVAVLFGLKLGWEQLSGALPFTSSTLAIPVITRRTRTARSGGPGRRLAAVAAAGRGSAAIIAPLQHD